MAIAKRSRGQNAKREDLADSVALHRMYLNRLQEIRDAGRSLDDTFKQSTLIHV